LAGFAVAAPFAVIFGPIGHDEEDPQSEVPEVLLIAFFLPVLVTGLSAVIRSLRPQKP
jgi:hypothetical protein